MELKERESWPVFRTTEEYCGWLDSMGDDVKTEGSRWLMPAVVKIGETYYGLPNGFYSYIRIKYQFIPWMQAMKEEWESEEVK